MMKRDAHLKTETLVISGSLFFFLLITTLGVLSRGTYGGADDIVHYQFSRYAWEKPELLLDHWAKPFYTLLASLFARFGFNGVKLMNALLATFSAYLVYRFSRSRGFPCASWGMLLCITAPLYFMMAGTGMTEVLFGFMLLGVSVLFLRRQYYVSMLILSFLPFVRTEAIVFYPVFLSALVLLRQWKPMLLLPAGFIIYSLAGWGHYNDLWWLVNRMPYTGARDIYGQGSLFHFTVNAHKIFGIPLLLFFIWGIVSRTPDIFRKNTYRRTDKLVWFLLVYLSPLVYFASHSVVWWRGWGSSLGLLRVMTGVVPLVALGAVPGVEGVLKQAGKNLPVRAGITVAVLILLAWQLLAWYPHPVPRDAETETVYNAGNWIKRNRLDNNKIFYYNPFVWYFLDRSPWDSSQIQERVPDPADPQKGIPGGGIIIWDSHFGPNEGRLPRERLDSTPELRLLETFLPAVPFTVSGGEPYQVRIYMKAGGRVPAREDISEKKNDTIRYVFKTGFEAFWKGRPEAYDSLEACGGRFSYRIGQQEEFGPALEATGAEMEISGGVSGKVSMDYRYIHQGDGPAVLVVSAQRGNRIYHYLPAEIPAGEDEGWKDFHLGFSFRLERKTDLFKLYVWNLHNSEILLDNLQLTLLSDGN